MRDLERDLAGARDLLVVDASERDTARALHRFEQRRIRRRRRQIGAGGVAAVTLVAAVAMSLPGADPIVVPATPIATTDPKPVAPQQRVVYFADGSHATLMQPRTEVRVEASQEDLLELSLAAGEARFEVVPSDTRLFRVRAQDLYVEVIGTSFTVAVRPEDEVDVSVHEGRVAVFAGDNRYELGRDMKLAFVAGRVVVDEAAVDEVEPAPEPKKAKKRRRRVRKKKQAQKKERWTALAEDGKFDDAFDALDRTPRAPRGTKDLMLAADVARLSGHPRDAARYLKLVVDRHPNHPRALVAAFTLGRLWQNELKEPRRAAEAFAKARALGPTGSLAEDALAHEAECWALAGERDKAKDRASTYLARYPEGRKVKSMRRLVGRAR